MEEPSQEAKDAGEEVSARGVLLGAGFIAGESLMGVLIAFFIVTWKAPHKWFGLGTLGDFWSLLFYAWFIGVFIFLATRALPRSRDGSNLLTDTAAVLTDGCRKFLKAVKPPR